jgi:predicted GH43/DUF377 family glycosyl hydrolase
MTESNSPPIERVGLICRPAGLPWSRSHCAVPFVQPLSPSTYRIHFSTRDAQNRSSGAWAEFEATRRGLSLLRFAPKPSIEPGRLGTFDDAGAMPSSIVQNGDRLMMYYSGWTRGGTVPFHFFIGLALSSDNGETFERVSEAPVLGRNRHDPLLAGAPWVLKDGGMFRMWYVSGTEWTLGSGGDANPVHHYTIKHATSDDGIAWQTNDRLCLPYLDNEHAIARPVVTKTAHGYHMIYSARRLGETYRIYSATSADGLWWQRDNAPMFDVAASGWDSEMVCYGSRLDTGQGNYLLYNGNAYGKDGFGAALLMPS